MIEEPYEDMMAKLLDVHICEGGTAPGIMRPYSRFLCSCCRGIKVQEHKMMKEDVDEYNERVFARKREYEDILSENQRLKETIQYLRKELEVYKKQVRDRYNHDYDHLPYEEDDK